MLTWSVSSCMSKTCHPVPGECKCKQWPRLRRKDKSRAARSRSPCVRMAYSPYSLLSLSPCSVLLIRRIKKKGLNNPAGQRPFLSGWWLVSSDLPLGVANYPLVPLPLPTPPPPTSCKWPNIKATLELCLQTAKGQEIAVNFT